MILLSSLNAFAYFTIATEDNKKNKYIHIAYFRTPHNDLLKVRARLYAGDFENQFCVKKTAINNIGFAKVQTGSVFAFDANKLKAIIGGGFECLVVTYQHQSTSTDVIRLVWDGKAYVGTEPRLTQVKIS